MLRRPIDRYTRYVPATQAPVDGGIVDCDNRFAAGANRDGFVAPEEQSAPQGASEQRGSTERLRPLSFARPHWSETR